MIPFLSLAGMFAQLIMAALSTNGVVSSGTSNLVTGLVQGVIPMLGQLTTGQTKVQDVLAVLGGMSTIIDTLRKDTALPKDTLNQINNVDSEIKTAMVAYVTAGTKFDPTAYAPVALIP